MALTFKPSGYSSLSPYLLAEDVPALAAQLKSIFGATELRRYDRDGRIVHMELKMDDSVLMLSSASEKYPAFTSILHMYVPDVLKTFQVAVEHGCEVLQEPVNQPDDPDTRGTFLDCAGNMWSISTQQSAG